MKKGQKATSKSRQIHPNSSYDLPNVMGRKIKDSICMVTFVRMAVLIWSASMLTLGYMGAMNKMDPTFVAAVFTSTLSTFGIDAQRKREEQLHSPSNSKKSVSRNTNTP